MDGKTTGRVAIGEIMGILKPWNPWNKKAKVLVKAEGEVVAVFVDILHLDYVRKKYSEKGHVVVGFYGGEWHIGVPAAPGEHTGETENYGLSGHVEKPTADRGAGKPGGDDENAVLDDIVVHREYIRQVETDIKEHGDEILGRLGLSHMKSRPEQKRSESMDKKPYSVMDGDKLDRVVAQNDEILSNQKETLWLLRKHIFPRENTGRSKSKFN